MKKTVKYLTVAIMVTVFAFNALAFQRLEGKLENSAIYPGTEHRFTVSIPSEYDGTKPACLYVGLDGALYNAPTVIDTLIAKGAMPVTIGVYFQPGTIKGSDGSIIRYNRSNEYDAVDDRLARFIETELLPTVEKMTTPNGLPILISKNPDDRAISGASSGGIGSFVVAWQRPDLFHRVYTTCGTYVAMRGGDQLPALVRKTEPLPLRLFIHDGSRDAWNPLFGHWYEQNRLIASSFEFAGYDMETKWDDGTHSISNGARIFPQVMEFLWKDYPNPITAGKSKNDKLEEIIIDGEEWKESPQKIDKPAPLALYFPNHKYYVYPTPSSQWLDVATLLPDGGLKDAQHAYLLHDMSFTDPKVIGMTFDSNGNLFVATQMGIQVCDQNGRVRAILRYPISGMPSKFCFNGDELMVELDGKTFMRKINAQAVAPEAAAQEVKSQGPA